MVACSSGDEGTPPAEETDLPQGLITIVPPNASFPEEDGSVKPSNDNLAKNLADFLTKAGPGIIKGLGTIPIKDEEYQEIKKFTDDLVKEGKSDKDKYDKIFAWIIENIKYEYGDNDPYPVFKNRKAICQGYANLLTVMLHSQGIPALNANGMLVQTGGHAWNYVYLDQWYVSDPTNKRDFAMSELGKYGNPNGRDHLLPLSIDADLFEDDNYVFNYQEGHLNLKKVKKCGKQLVVPFSTNGFRVTSFNPSEELPSNAEEIYLGYNIKTLGESMVGLNHYAPHVKYAYVDTKNATMKSYGQVVYRESTPYYIPAAATTIQLKSISSLGKNFLANHPKVENLVVSSGTKTLESYAIENCPNLRKAYVPENAKLADDAFYGVHSTFQIIRKNIKE